MASPSEYPSEIEPEIVIDLILSNLFRSGGPAVSSSFTILARGTSESEVLDLT